MTAAPSLFDDEHPTEPNHLGGAPPLDWWVIATTKDEAYRRVIAAMCPEKVCRQCGKPSRRIVETETWLLEGPPSNRRVRPKEIPTFKSGSSTVGRKDSTGYDAAGQSYLRVVTSESWTDCGHNDWRPGVWLDPFNPEAS